ncbi:MAG: ammonia channel protein [Candidatus Dactylopiibacterium carminicum]|uniref:Ammonium transporter n=1 Tax=Candidatus Dactylopiibacterium carminicum TaxID=857335 RepID=A0A272EWZ4_9RHOO|nr:ammonium transporter [Candidatus Dactylopiibacterium carminicum]KAF7600308.1 ammonia channel protein [Candidatus Dactylopiibacterium carminicum]PAS94638.1 MAG: ammonia channel protein [Candidatus Dactylopiibacterium carminicum]PAS96927.1 MAG: ammonia channel protein [Candidatus Dactylopiibacterium carminicum]PAT00310.1 MAG: ammonia channel protein [Candidatus Dactylopiibacterium carminicum]
MKKTLALAVTALSVLFAGAVLAQDAAPVEAVSEVVTTVVETTTAAVAPAAAAEEAAPAIDSGDVAWMLTSTMLVILMTIPGLALFYGGLARSKNMLSVLMQVFVIFSVITILWCIYGYSLAFAGEGKFVGDLSKIFLAGITPDTPSAILATIPEYVFVVFQSTFAAITTALIVGSFAERIKFSAVILFSVIWFTFSYVPMAHIVWGGGLLGADGPLDFAGGTVVHINAGIAGLVGAYVLGKRIGFGRESFAPHSLTLTMVGASLLWVGWFGFNAGSAGAANGVAGLAFINTVVATGAATVAWIGGEALFKGKPSMLGAASGAVAGLVAITPAAGFVGPMGAIVLGLISGLVCLWGVSGLKRMLGADDAFDVFGVHGVGGIVGAILTGVFASQSLGGTGGLTPDTFSIGSQVWIQIKSVLFTIVWSGVVSFIAYKLVDIFVGLRVPEEEEREGLDVTSHGEQAYHY